MKLPHYSLRRRDKKLAGVCSTLGELFNIDPTFLRIGFVAAAFLVSWEVALVTYVGTGLWLHFAKRRALRGRPGDLDRMEERQWSSRTSIHQLRTQLDANDRRMMAIDQHLHRQNEELAREIEALRGEEK